MPPFFCSGGFILVPSFLSLIEIIFSSSSIKKVGWYFQTIEWQRNWIDFINLVTIHFVLTLFYVYLLAKTFSKTGTQLKKRVFKKFEPSQQNLKICRIREKQKTNPKNFNKSSKRITQFFCFALSFNLHYFQFDVRFQLFETRS